MTANISMRIRIIALVGLLAALLLGAATFMMSGSTPETVEASAPAPAPTRAKAAKSATPARTKAEKSAAPARPKTKTAPAPVEPVPQPATGIPAAVVEALAVRDVVVVSLVSPNAPLDELAAAEAQAGAKRAGAGFVKVEVADKQDLKRLAGELGVRHTPTVLVFVRPDRVFVQVKGFADSQTVAQAAANAS
jgi:hypothetical protein